MRNSAYFYSLQPILWYCTLLFMPDFSKPDTPLTPEQQLRKQRRNSWLLIGLLWGSIAIWEGRKLVNGLLVKAAILDLPWPVLVLGWIIGIPILYLLMIVVHEGGHVVGALLARFRVLSFAASWLHITRKAEGWKVQLQKPTARLAGMVQAFPMHNRNLRSRYAVMIAGGPLANVLTGALALFLRHTLTASPGYVFSASGYLLSNVLLVFGWLSVLMGALNLLPRDLPSGHIIDGKRLWNLIQRGPAMHQHVGLLYFQSLTYAGIRPRNWDASLLEAFVAHRSNGVLDFYAHLYAYAYYHDCQDLEGMRLHLNEALERRKASPVLMQQYVLAEAAYVAALHTHDTEQARYWLNLAQEVKPFAKQEGLLPQAAVAFAEGQLAEAESWLQAARQQLQEAIDTGGKVQAFEQIDDLHTRIQQARLQLQPA